MDLSLEAQQEKIEGAFYEAFPIPTREQVFSAPEYGMEIEATYPDHVIVCLQGNGEEYYRVDYTINETGGVTFAPRETWQRMEETNAWVEAKHSKAKMRRYTYNGVDVQASARRPSSRDDKKYERTVLQDGKEYLVHYGDPNLDMQRDVPERRENFLARHSCDTKRDPKAPGFWACYDWENTDEGKSLDETLVYFGDAVKALGEGRVGGYLVRFGSPDDPDLEGDYFDRGTDFGRANKSAVYYQHGLDPILKRRVIGEGAIRVDDVGVWIEAQLSMRDEYERAIYSMAEKGKLGWSSGTAGHLVEREQKGRTYHVTNWPLGLDASLTPTPAEPKTLAVPLKSLKPQQATPQDTGDVSGDAPGAETERKQITFIQPNEEKKNMAITNAELLDALKQLADGKLTASDEREVLPERFQSYENQVKAINDRLNAVDELVNVIKASGKAKDAGYVAPDSEADHAEAKSFGDFLIAIQNKNRTRLEKVYKTALTESSGPAGGYVVPTEYGALIEKNGAELNVLQRAGAMVERMTANEKEIPVVDLETAPTAGNTSYAGGTVAYWTGEGAAITESEPALKLVRLVLHKLAALSLASAEVRVDARTSIDGMLARSFGRAVNSQKNYQFFRGDGASRPQGVLASGAIKSTTRSAASAVALADVANMFAGLTPDSYGTAAWFVNPGAMAKLMQIADDPISYLPDLSATVPMRLLGLPVYVTGALPALNTLGDILLIDPQYYVIGEHVSGLSIAYSEHYKFNTDQHTWKVTQRVDGRPLIDSVITLENAVTTVSPFVGLAAG